MHRIIKGPKATEQCCPKCLDWPGSGTWKIAEQLARSQQDAISDDLSSAHGVTPHLKLFECLESWTDLSSATESLGPLKGDPDADPSSIVC